MSMSDEDAMMPNSRTTEACRLRRPAPASVIVAVLFVVTIGLSIWYLIKGINSLVQAAKAKARGYRSIRNLKAIVYLLAGKLDLQLPA